MSVVRPKALSVVRIPHVDDMVLARRKEQIAVRIVCDLGDGPFVSLELLVSTLTTLIDHTSIGLMLSGISLCCV